MLRHNHENKCVIYKARCPIWIEQIKFQQLVPLVEGTFNF